MPESLLKIRNHHTPMSGDAPVVDGDSANKYIGYFENPYGEQWIFTFDRESGTAILRGGDIGWDEPIDVTNGNTDLMLGKEEQLWLQACLLASKQQRSG